MTLNSICLHFRIYLTGCSDALQLGGDDFAANLHECDQGENRDLPSAAERRQLDYVGAMRCRAVA